MDDPAEEPIEFIGCLLSEREMAIRGEEIARSLFCHVDAIAELSDGYGYRFADGDAHLEAMLAFVAAERRCCPFLTFDIAFEPHSGPIWLRLRGSGRVKGFIAETFNARTTVAADALGVGG